MKKIRIAYKYLIYLLKAKSKHTVHSPFVFDFMTKVLDDHTYYPEYEKVEQQYQKLLHNRNRIETVDFGSSRGRIGYTTRFRSVKEIASHAGIPGRYGRLLFRIIRYFTPQNILEMGTSVGISAIYQASAAPQSRFMAIEGCASTAALAVESLEAAGVKNVEILIGKFDLMLPKALEKLPTVDYAFIDGNHTYAATLQYFIALLPKVNDNSIFIFHDICWSAGMEQAWAEIKQHPQVTLTIDLFFMGIVFFRKGMVPQHFILRY